jgi:abortive infection bacteriophage resistance protein
MKIRTAHLGGFSVFMKHTKRVISVPEQIELLRSRGMTISNEEIATEFLNKVSYFKFSAYLKEFEVHPTTHTFREGTCIEHPIELCLFDSKLRSILFDALEEIELAFKTKLINAITPVHGNNWYEDYNLFNDTEDFKFASYLAKLHEKITNPKTKEKFITHYNNTYKTPEHPPVWMIMEIITLGTTSKMYDAFKDKNLRADVSWHFIEMIDKIFTTWIHHLTYLRNLCAHHCVVWNRLMIVRPRFPTSKKNKFIDDIESMTEEVPQRYAKVYASLCIINYMMIRINRTSAFKEQVLELMNTHPTINIDKMGFTPKWREENLWS